MDFDLFKHAPLPTPTSIRVLRIVRGTEKDSEDSFRIADIPLIQCVLSTIDLDLTPRFTSLSYTWGSPRIASVRGGNGQYEYNLRNRYPILINGKLFYVLRNLYELIARIASGPALEVIQHKPYMKTDLHEAAESGASERVEILIERGVDLDVIDMFGETSLHYAAENGHAGAVAKLIAAGARMDVVDSHGRTALQCAEQQQRREWQEVVKLLKGYAEQAGSNNSKIAKGKEVEVDLTDAFWIDAICIDQSNLAERSAQVAMMPRIYQAAELIIIWLGSLDTADTRDLVHWLYTDEMKENFVIQLMLLTLSSWFSRLWVVQELNLAKTVKVLYGDCLFGWNSILRILAPYMASWRSAAEGTKQAVDSKNAFDHENPDPFLMARLRLHINADPIEQHVLQATPRDAARLSLPLLLAMTWDFRCTDARDHIYALLSFAQPLQLPPTIDVDYTVPVEAIYIAAAHHFVRGSGEEVFHSGIAGSWEDQGLEPLEALSFIQRGPSRTRERYKLSLPSWVPNLSTFLTTRRMYQREFSTASKILLKLEMNVKDGIPGTILGLSGVEFDTIDRIEDRSTDTLVEHEPDEGAWLDISAQLSKGYPATDETPLRVFVSTLTAGHQSDTDQLLPFCKVLSVATTTPSASQLVRTIPILQKVVCALKLPDEELPSKGPIEDIKPDWSEKVPPYIVVATRFYNTRRFLFTKKGYFGLGPGDMRLGDVIVLIAGSRVPYVMRRVDRDGQSNASDCPSYEFVGEVYVHGIMHGEAVSANGAEFGKIELR